jgi:TolB protein
MLNEMMRKGFFILFTLIQVAGWAKEEFDSNLEEKILKNIQQLTTPSMGFERAGEAYFSPDGNKIVFQAVLKGENSYQIYIMDLEERVPRLISTGKGACTCAYFRPDGKKVIFASSHEDPRLSENIEENSKIYLRQGSQYQWDFTPYMNIYEANLDGSCLTPLTHGESYHAECAYSSDGTRIVFASNEDGSMNLYTMKFDGTDVQQITHTNSSYNGGPFFSPDSSQIIFRSDRDQRDYLQIYLIQSDGTHEQQLTNNGEVNWAPYWHPNGKVIAFTTSLHGHLHYEIYLLHLSTETFVRVTHHPGFDGLPVFNREGNKLMWTSKRGIDQTCQVFIADFIMPEDLN